VKKEILAFLMSSRLWRQVVSINSWHQDALSIKKVTSRCLAPSRSHIPRIWYPGRPLNLVQTIISQTTSYIMSFYVEQFKNLTLGVPF